jgi:hypothetical protein
VTIFWDERDDEDSSLEECFLKRHGDAKWWIPGKQPAHTVCGLSSL